MVTLHSARGPNASTSPDHWCSFLHLQPQLDKSADGRPSPEAEASSREHLTRLWEEIMLLPLRQRTALLLNLRDERGASAIEIFPFCGVATVGALADALGLERNALAELWPSLPLDDLAIAERLGATRQQVINLRRCARERLARRMKARSRNNAAKSPSAESKGP